MATPMPARTAVTETLRPARPKVTIATAAAALAPAVMPMMSGLARGLRRSVWKVRERDQ